MYLRNPVHSLLRGHECSVEGKGFYLLPFVVCIASCVFHPRDCLSQVNIPGLRVNLGHCSHFVIRNAHLGLIGCGY